MAVAEQRHTDAGPQRDDEQRVAPAAGPVVVFTDGGGDGVVVDDAADAESVADDVGDGDVGVGRQCVGVADDSEPVDRAAGADTDRAQRETGRGRGDAVGELSRGPGGEIPAAVGLLVSRRTVPSASRTTMRVPVPPRSTPTVTGPTSCGRGGAVIARW